MPDEKTKVAARTAVIREASLLSFINSDHLVRCHELYEYRRRIWMIIDYMNFGSQEKLVSEGFKDVQGRKQRIYDADFCRHCLFNVTLAVNAMHQQNVLHRDIKSDNVLADDKGRVKLADLGFSNFLSDRESHRKTQGGTQNWIAPEIAKGVKYSKEVDVWSLGCYAQELATGKPPFAPPQFPQDKLFDSIVNAEHTRIEASVWGNDTEDFQDFIDVCLKKNPSDRPSA